MSSARRRRVCELHAWPLRARHCVAPTPGAAALAGGVGCVAVRATVRRGVPPFFGALFRVPRALQKLPHFTTDTALGAAVYPRGGGPGYLRVNVIGGSDWAGAQRPTWPIKSTLPALPRAPCPVTRRVPRLALSVDRPHMRADFGRRRTTRGASAQVTHEFSWCVPVVHHYRVVSLSGSAVQRPGELCVPTDSPALPACVWLAEALGYVVVPLRHAASRVGVPWYPACTAACLDVLCDALSHSRPANRASACTAS